MTGPYEAGNSRDIDKINFVGSPALRLEEQTPAAPTAEIAKETGDAIKKATGTEEEKK